MSAGRWKKYLFEVRNYDLEIFKYKVRRSIKLLCRSLASPLASTPSTMRRRGIQKSNVALSIFEVGNMFGSVLCLRRQSLSGYGVCGWAPILGNLRVVDHTLTRS